MKWTINRKLLGGFTVVIAILMLTVAVSYYQMKSIEDSYTLLLEDRAQKVMDIKELQAVANDEVASMNGYLILGDDQSKQNYYDAREDYQKKSQNLRKKFTNQTNIQMMKELDQIEKDFFQLAEQAFELKKQDKTEAYSALIGSQGRDITRKFDEQAVKLVNYQTDILEKGSNANTAKVNMTEMQLLVLGGIAVLIAVGTALIMGRLISKPVVAIANAAAKISNGDLSVDKITIKNRDEIGELAHSFNQMASNLRNILERVRLNSMEVASSAEELAATAEQTSKATTQITSAIQEIASGAETQGREANESSVAMKEMTIGIREVAKATYSVSELALETSKEANNGNNSLQKVIHQMNTINEVVDDSAAVVKNLGEHSKEIGQIIEVITSIAEQTNLLALNAAIESARAGEHGRGFAVVADEVRKLAEQSKDSAYQIAALIQKIQGDTTHAIDAMDNGTQEVKVGMEVVREAGEGFEKILGLITQVTDQIQEASASSEEMSASVEQINSSIEGIARIAQVSANNTQNVAGASNQQLAAMEQISSSVVSLSQMAGELQNLVSQFKL